MAAEQWTVDGYPLSNPGAGIEVESVGGFYVAPGPAGDNVDIPGMTGQLWRPKRHGAGRFVLNIWAEGAAGQAALEVLYDEVLRVLLRPWEQLSMEHTLAGGSVRRCLCEVPSELAPTPVNGQVRRFAPEFVVPGGYWESAGVFSQSTGAGDTLRQHLPLTAFAASTAPMEDLVVTIDGPVTNPQVIDATGGADRAWFAYTGTIPDDHHLTVDAGTWAVTGNGSFTPNPAALTYSGARYLSVVPARPGGVPEVQLRGGAGGAGTRLTVAGRQKFLI